MVGYLNMLLSWIQLNNPTSDAVKPNSDFLNPPKVQYAVQRVVKMPDYGSLFANNPPSSGVEEIATAAGPQGDDGLPKNIEVNLKGPNDPRYMSIGFDKYNRQAIIIRDKNGTIEDDRQIFGFIKYTIKRAGADTIFFFQKDITDEKSRKRGISRFSGIKYFWSEEQGSYWQEGVILEEKADDVKKK